MLLRSWSPRRGVALLAVAVASAGSPASAQDAMGPPEWEEESLLSEGTFGAAAASVSMFYAPLKLAYATSGLVLGMCSFLWSWGDKEASMAVIAMSVGGDYVITPEHLKGRADIRFTGTEDGDGSGGASPPPAQVVSAPPP